VKFTTARLVAEKTLKQIFGQEFNLVSSDGRKPLTEKELEIYRNDWSKTEINGYGETLKEIISNESVVHLEDFMIRRTTIGDKPDNALKHSKKICSLFGWNEQEAETEIMRLKSFYDVRALIGKKIMEKK
jgi:glycerol-3-phosphate dehydrogenase